MNNSVSTACNRLPFRKAFSQIYIEEAIKDHPRTKRLLEAFSTGKPLLCRNYKDIFCRGSQSPALQKSAPALILAEAHAPFCYKGAAVCQSFDNRHFYYTSGVMNCIYDCEYCYLQGMYPSGHVVIFVNLEDTFQEISTLLREHPMYVCISYDTDLFALEGKTGLLRDWCAFAADNPELTLEIRTKCASVPTLRSLPVLPNVILALTLSPDAIVARYEHGTPSLQARLHLAECALEAGWQLRLCFDPMISVPDYRLHYHELFADTFSAVDSSVLRDVSLGVFRISKDYLKNMRAARPCEITYYPYELTNGVYHYGTERSGEMLRFAKSELLHYIPEEKIFTWEDINS